MKKQWKFWVLLVFVGLVMLGCETFDDFAYGYAHGREWLSYDGEPITPSNE